jgi:hypothetical protein
MDIKVPLDVYIETLRTAAREGDSFQWSLGQFEWLLRNFRISDHSAVYEPEELGAKPAFRPQKRGK